MIPIMAAQLMSFADVQYRQAELAEEFARVRRGRRRRQERRAARHARTAASRALATTTITPASTPSAPTSRPSTTGIPTQTSTDRPAAAASSAGQHRPAA